MGRNAEPARRFGRRRSWCRDVSLRGRGRFPSEYHEDMLEVLTAAVAAAITGPWNTVQIGRLSGRHDTLTIHVNAPGLHTH